jgi:hypothetical protein
VTVHDGIIPGQAVRASTGGYEYLVRVPWNARTGDSFIFELTEEDMIRAAKYKEAIAAASSGTNNNGNPNEPPPLMPYIENAYLDTRSSALIKKQALQFQTWLEQEILVDYTRVVCLLMTLVFAGAFGFITGLLYITRNECAATPAV